MRKLLLPLLLISGHLFSQELPGDRTINWNTAIESPGGDFYLNFTGANYPDIKSLLPNYYELVKIGNNFEPDIEIFNKKFEIITNQELNNIPSLESLPKELHIQTEHHFSRKQAYLGFQFIPLRRNVASGQIERLVSFSYRIRDKGPVAQGFLKSSAVQAESMEADNSVLRSGYWYRIRVEKDGIYSLSFEELRSLGFSNPNNIRIFGNADGLLPLMNSEAVDDDLTEIPYSSITDGIIFYGRGPHSWEYDTLETFYKHTIHHFTDASYYFLTSDQGLGKLVQEHTDAAGAANKFVSDFDVLYHHELNDRNLIKSGREWYGEHFDIQTTHSFSFDVPGLIISDSIKMKVRVLAAANSVTSFSIAADNQSLGTISIRETHIGNYTASAAYAETRNYTYLPSGSPTEIELRYNKSSASAQGWLDYLTINARRKISLVDDQLHFRDASSAGEGNITEFTVDARGESISIWDITDPDSPIAMRTSNSSGNYSFTVGTSVLREFVAFNIAGDFLKPVTEGDDVGVVPNQDLHGSGQPDYIIISHPDFIEQARRLAAYRYDHNDLDTLVVTPQQVYNEFSSGKPDVSALRNFVRMFYSRAASEDEMPRYLLLFGDGSYDNRSQDEQNTNYILTYQSGNSLSPTASFITDDFFGLLDPLEGGSSGLIDIGIGRFPVGTVGEATNMVNKTLGYEQPDKMGDWRNTICFIGDDEDGNVHMSQADQLARYVENKYPSFTISKIYLDAYRQTATPSGERYPDVNEALNQRINKGALIINYTGHGGARGLAHEQILNSNDVVSWENQDRLPLFMTATCEFSRFDNYEETSAGELVLLNPDGGGIALLTTTRLVYSGPNHALNERFYEYVFEKDQDNNNYLLGDIIRLTKMNTSTGIQKRNFALLGDPVVELSYPTHRIIATAINGVSTYDQTDTLKALSTVSISGQITDEQGLLLDGYNGILYPTVYDKPDQVMTLANDGGNAFSFELRSRILYKGKATISNGEFSFKFVVPKDISYNYDFGRLSFYASGASEDASGSFDRVLIGGSSGSASTDDTGPGIRIFMNDENFVSGGITDDQPTLLVFVNDSSGINTIGSGIGHDITAILDNNTNNSFVLNDFYEANTDSYQEGRISYKFKSLNEGEHLLTLKVWDVHNNSSEDYVDFIVSDSEDFILKRVLNYPNPFTTNTSFFFEHNRPDTDLEIIIQVFTVSGKLVKTIERYVSSTGYRTDAIQWDGLDDFGSRIGRGVYIYRVKVRTNTGETVEKFEKLVILR